jgi:DNA-binding MarR family transcriptional regulator
MKAAEQTSIERAACVAGSLRRAARSVTRVYDGHLAHAGLTITQLSILCTLKRRGGQLALAELATDLVFERTSLYRALAPLRRAGLLSVRIGADVRTRKVALTARGRRRIAEAMPHWVAAQQTVLDHFGLAAWHDLAKRIGELTAIARAVHPR